MVVQPWAQELYRIALGISIVSRAGFVKVDALQSRCMICSRGQVPFKMAKDTCLCLSI